MSGDQIQWVKDNPGNHSWMNSPQEILPGLDLGTTAQAPGHVSAPGTGADALALDA